MSDSKPSRPKARLPRGFRDRDEVEIPDERVVLDVLRRVYELYGFAPLETPAFEYTDALGKFLPDLDRPNEGVFSLQDDDGQWLSLRYDLTAPLARYVAANFQNLTKPFRRYQVGPVWRNEKPGPGRFREFLQFDADTVGSASPSADAELLMMLSDALKELGLKSGEYIVKLNNRKLLDGVLETVGISMEDRVRRGVVMRAIDKVDRLGFEGVAQLLGEGRKDESGDFTKGAGLSYREITRLLAFTGAKDSGSAASAGFNTQTTLANYEDSVAGSETGASALKELMAILEIVQSCGYESDRIQLDPSIVRGLDYYTGAVFEAQLTYPVKNESGETVVFGSVAGGGRYDDLVTRFTGQQVPATGVSIGVSRLIRGLPVLSAVRAKLKPLIVVTVMDDAVESFKIAAELRNELGKSFKDLSVEAYTGNKKLQDQLRYADKRRAIVAVIQGSNERSLGKVTIKQMEFGKLLSESLQNREQWLAGQADRQITVDRQNLVEEVRKALGSRDWS